MQKKAALSFSLAALLIFMLFFSVRVSAKPNKDGEAPYINARFAVALDAKSKRVLYEKGSHIITPMASTTKIITALVTLKYGDLDRKIDISAKAASIRGSVVGYKKGEKVTVKELLYGLMLRSGNDAAIAIAEGIGGSVEGFVKLMNEYATEIGLIDTHFESPHGLDSTMHYTTAYDLAVATAKAREVKGFNEIVSSKDVNGNEKGFGRSFHNINKILWQIPEATGVKTGYTGQAGKCLVSSFRKDGNDIIVVVLNCNQRWQETKKVYDYVCKAYQYKEVASKDVILATLDVIKGDQKLNIKAKENIAIPNKLGSNLDVKIKIPKEIESPINKDDKIASLYIYEEGNLIYKTPLYSDNLVLKKKGIKRWFQIFQ